MDKVDKLIGIMELRRPVGINFTDFDGRPVRLDLPYLYYAFMMSLEPQEDGLYRENICKVIPDCELAKVLGQMEALPRQYRGTLLDNVMDCCRERIKGLCQRG